MIREGTIGQAEFIGAKFDDYELPPERKYLLKYFTTDIERAFLGYYLVAGNYHRFTDHTGYYCSRRWLRIMRVKLEKLEKVHAKARVDLDISLVACIESGRWRESGVQPTLL